MTRMVQKQQENNAIQHRIEYPGANSVAPTSEKVKQEHPHMAHHVATQQQDLAVNHKWKARATQPHGRPEPVPVHHRMHQSGEQNRQHLKRLREFEPQEGREG